MDRYTNKYVAIFYKTKGSQPKTNHYLNGGLAANVIHTAEVLSNMGVHVDLHPVSDYTQLIATLYEASYELEYVVIEAVWLSIPQLAELIRRFPHIRFVIRAHSKIGFLQVEPEAIPVIRWIIAISKHVSNISFSSNNEEFSEAMAQAYGPVEYLPNLYDLAGSPGRHVSLDSRTIKIASFGATRLLKMHPAAALASLQIHQMLQRPLEFYINTDTTPGGESVIRTVRNLFAGVPHTKVVEVGWQPSDQFRDTIAGMDLVFQLSTTETFCLVAADAVASGVPVVVGTAIDWVPEKFRVNVDRTSDAAELGARIIGNDRRVVALQQVALGEFVEESKATWADYLGLPKKKWHHRVKAFLNRKVW